MSDYYESKCHSEKKKTKENDDASFNEEMKNDLKKLKRFIKLSHLKSEEKLWELNEPFIDFKKQNLMFFRPENKLKLYIYEPSTNFCGVYRGKSFSTLYKKNVILNGFRNYSNYPKEETEIFPMNFEDINAEIELKKTQDNINKNKLRIRLQNNMKTNHKNKIIKKTTENINNQIDNRNSSNNKLKNINKRNNNDLSAFQNNINKSESIKILHKKNSSSYFSDFSTKTKESAVTSNKKLDEYYLKTENRKEKYKSKIKPLFSVNKTPSAKKSRNKKLFKDIENQILNQKKNSISRNNKIFYSQKKNKSNVSNNTNNSNDTSVFKSTKEIISRALNDGDIIKNCIINKSNEINKAYKIDAEEILLKLAERLKVKKTNRNYKLSKKHIILSDEDFYKKKLSKIPKRCKNFFREVYRRILLETRFLNKDDNNPINKMEENLSKKKLQEQFKKIAHDQMVCLKDNIITEKDDKKLLKEQYKYDFYGNLDGLEWLIVKQSIFGFDKKFIGAYNPSLSPKIKFIKYKV